MSQVFISYKREEQERARLIARALTKEGFDVWWDDRLLPGQWYYDKIEAAIEQAGAVVVLWSTLSVKSNDVKAEVMRAYNAGKLVPLRIDDCVVPLPFDTIQTIDLFEWNGDSEVPVMRKVIDGIVQLAGPPREEPKTLKEVESELSQKEALPPLPDEAQSSGVPLAVEHGTPENEAKGQPYGQETENGPAGGEGFGTGPAEDGSEEAPRAGMVEPAPDTGMVSPVSEGHIAAPALEGQEETADDDARPAPDGSPTRDPTRESQGKGSRGMVTALGLVTVLGLGFGAYSAGLIPLGQDTAHPDELPLATELATDARAPILSAGNPLKAKAAFRDCDTCPDMVVLPGKDGPGRLAAGRFEVTFGEWQACVDAGGCEAVATFTDPRLPVHPVNWSQAKAYAAWLSDKTGEVYRLPSRDEWQTLASAGARTDYWWGDEWEDGRAVYNADTAEPVGALGDAGLNAWGISATLGNVQEWGRSCVSGQSPPCYVPSFGAGFTSIKEQLYLNGEARLHSSDVVTDIGLRVVRRIRLAED